MTNKESIFDPSNYKKWGDVYGHKWVGGNNNIKYSQGTQEGILKYIFNKIGTYNNPPQCVEFGHNRDDFYGTNTGYLCEVEGWKGILFDSNNSNNKINLKKELITYENIIEIFEKYNISKTCDLICIDVDSIEIWLWEKLLKNNYRASVFLIEFNSIYTYYKTYLTHPHANTKEELSNILWDGSRIQGSSLQALNMLADKYNYVLVGLETYKSSDCFFIRKDLCPNNILSFEEIYNQYFLKGSSKNNFYKIFDKKPEPIPRENRHHKLLNNPIWYEPYHKKDNNNRYKILWDYRKYIETNNPEEANKEAQTVINNLNLVNVFKADYLY